GLVLFYLFQWLDRRFQLSTRSNGVSWVGAAFVVASSLYFFLLYWNHFLGLRSGNGALGAAVSYLEGLRPYRDYYCAVTPLDILKWTLVTKLLGAKLIVVRGFAIFDRLLLGVILYLWLRRIFSARDSALATIVAIILSAGDLTDPLASYNHDTILLAVVSGFLASFALDEQRKMSAVGLFAVLSGCAACLSFASKQTIGLGVSIAIPVVMAISLSICNAMRRSSVFVGGFAVGWLICASVIAAWLAGAGLWSDFLRQVFLQGPAAKARHLSDFVDRALLIGQQLRAEALFAAAALVGGGAAILSSMKDAKKEKNTYAGFLPLILVVVLGFVAIKTPITVSIFEKVRHAMIFVAVITSVAVGLYCFARCITLKLRARETQFLLFAAVSFSVAFMLSLSWPYFEAMLLPGLALFVAATMDGSRFAVRQVVYVLCGILIVAQVNAKLAAPFGFAGWSEAPVSSATASPKTPALSGMRISPKMADFVDETVRIVEEHSTSNDSIFTYPEFGILYAVTNRRPPTFSWSHNIDVVNESMAAEEADRIVRGRPSVLIYGLESKLALRADELLWREGKQSEQRLLIGAVESLASEYCLEREFQLDDGHMVRVYIRPSDRGACRTATK
ncbi:MAG TPA: hypothetical protein VF135_06900, partial [Terriglobales bacterium]